MNRRPSTQCPRRACFARLHKAPGAVTRRWDWKLGVCVRHCFGATGAHAACHAVFVDAVICHCLEIYAGRVQCIMQFLHAHLFFEGPFPPALRVFFRMCKGLRSGGLMPEREVYSPSWGQPPAKQARANRKLRSCRTSWSVPLSPLSKFARDPNLKP